MDVLERNHIVMYACKNAKVYSEDGSKHKNDKCIFDSQNVMELSEYMKKSEKEDTVNDDKKAEKQYIIPITLENGEKIMLGVNAKGQDMFFMYQDDNGNFSKFAISERFVNEIYENAPRGNLELVFGEKTLKEKFNEFLPGSLDEYYEMLNNDSFNINSTKKFAKIAGIDSTKERIEAKEELEESVEAEEKKNAKEEIPEEVRDEISVFCTENDLDISKLKEVMIVPPEVITENLEKTEMNEKDGYVYCMRFRDASFPNDRIVMIQPGNKPLDERKYDDYMNSYMNEHRGFKGVQNLKDKPLDEENDKLIYTDLDGNTIVSEINKEPRDLSLDEKENLNREMEKLESAQEAILNSNMSLEDKIIEIQKINYKRLGLFNDYGIEPTEVSDEIEADIDITEDVQEDINEEKEEIPEEENLDDEKSDDDENLEDGRYPNGRVPKWLQ